jgi:hypothetical protein
MSHLSANNTLSGGAAGLRSRKGARVSTSYLSHSQRRSVTESTNFAAARSVRFSDEAEHTRLCLGEQFAGGVGTHPL